MQVGTRNISNGADIGAITLLGMSSTPRRAFAWVRKPVGGLDIWANIVDGTLSYDGFQFTLSGQTDSASYLLDYMIL